MPERERIAFADADAWELWLEENHAASPGIELLIAKKGSGIPSVTYAEALDVALCFGWIDALKRRVDDEWFMQVFLPRRPRSVWSRINREKVATLIETGRMRPAGQREIDRAKADGRWDAAYASQSSMTVPEDLAAALAARPEAAAFFETLSSQNRYAVLLRIHGAKRPDTRQRRIAQFADMLERGETVYPQR